MPVVGKRFSDLLIVSIWLVAMAWLAARDVVPQWYQTPPPQSLSLSWLKTHGKQFQYGFFGDNAVRVGTAWSTYQVGVGASTVTRNDTVVLNNVPMAPDGVIIQSRMEFLDENRLDELEVKIFGAPVSIALEGESQGPRFAFRLLIDGQQRHEFVLDANAAETLCDTIKPFSALVGLTVGQSWTVHVLDPFSLMQGSRRRLKSTLVTVTGREVISHQGREHECFVVQSEGVRAYVDDVGRVLRQVVDLPGLGGFEIIEEDFQKSKLDAIKIRADGYDEKGSRARSSPP